MQKHLFSIILRYVQDMKGIDNALPAHRMHLEQGYKSGLLLASGPIIPRSGGVILACATCRLDVENFIEGDPFYKQKLAEYNIYEFEPRLYAKALEFVLTPLPQNSLEG